MTKSFKTLLMAGAAIFALGVTPTLADSGINATAGANVDAGARIQGDNTGTTAGTTVDTLMEREDALKSDTITGEGLTLDNQTNVDVGTHTDVDTGVAEPIGNTERMNFNDADANSDGLVDEAEFSTSIDADTSAESFGEFDRNSDGSLDDTEYRSYFEADAQTEAEVETME